MMHAIKINGQAVVSSANVSVIVEGTQEFVYFKFELSDDWDGLTVFAQFTQNGTSYNQYLDENNMAALPAEIASGECTLCIRGDSGTVTAISDFVTLTVRRKKMVDDAESTVITQSLYQQLVDKVDGLVDEAKEEAIAGAKQYSEDASSSATNAAKSAGEAANSATKAKTSEENSAKSEEAAEDAAERAEQSAAQAGWMKLIAGEDGHLYLQHTNNLTVSLSINDEGRLIATYG